MEPEILISRSNEDVEGDEDQAVNPEARTLEVTDTYGKFVMEPLGRGFGTTIGNPLRRVLLSSVPGVAVTWVQIEGALHEYFTLPGMKEEVMEFLQNVKKIRLRSLSENPGRMRLEVKGPGVVSAGDIVSPSDVTIINPDLYLATLDSSEGSLQVDFNLEVGKGYRPGGDDSGMSIGVLPVDAIFSPVVKVDFSVEHTRVGQFTDYERLVIEVWTDGSVLPAEAVRKASEVLVDQMFLFSKVSDTVEADEEQVPKASVPVEIYNTTVDKLELSSRTFNSLKRADINKVGDLLEISKSDLLKIRNFGDKSLEELQNRLTEAGFPLPEDNSLEEIVEE